MENINNRTPQPVTPNSLEAKSNIVSIVITIIVLLVVGFTGYWFWQNSSTPAEEPQIENEVTAEESFNNESATAADLPTIETNTDVTKNVTPVNPVEEVPDLNPINSSNPFSNGFENPFQ